MRNRKKLEEKSITIFTNSILPDLKVVHFHAITQKKNGQKNKMAFLKDGNLIYLTDKVGTKLRVVFLVEWWKIL